MKCDQAERMLNAHVDGELDPAQSFEIEEHLANCACCRQMSEGITNLRGSMTPSSLYYNAPPALAERICGSLEEQTAALDRSMARAPLGNTVRYTLWWPAVAAAIIVAGIAGGIAGRSFASDDRLTNEVLSEHVRSLMAAHLVDVPSTDQHTVKPWFDGKIDFAPPVGNFSAKGFPLYGGRLDYLEGRPVAALIYQRKKHFVNVFIWPTTEKESSPRDTARSGYNMIHWSQSSMTFWAVSDLNRDELMELVGLIKGTTTTGPS